MTELARRVLGREVASDRAVRRLSAILCYLGQAGLGVGIFTISFTAAPFPWLGTLKELALVAGYWWLLAFSAVSLLVLLVLLFGGDTLASYRAAVRLGAAVLAIDVAAVGWSFINFEQQLLRMDPGIPLVVLTLHALSFGTLYGLRPPAASARSASR